MNDFQGYIARLFQRIQHVIRISRTTAPAIESDNIAKVQMQSTPFDLRDHYSMQLYGFASAIDKGTDIITVAIAGDQSNAIGIASNNQSLRPKNMKTNETQIYDDKKQSVYLQKIDGNTAAIVITGANQVNATSTDSMLTATQKYTLNCYDMTVNANKGGGRSYTLNTDTITLNCKTLVINATTSVTVTSPNVKFTGNVEIDGDLIVKGAITSASGAPGGSVGLLTHTHYDVDGSNPAQQTGPPKPGT